MSKSPFHYFVSYELMIAYFKKSFKDNNAHIQAIFTFSLYIMPCWHRKQIMAATPGQFLFRGMTAIMLHLLQPDHHRPISVQCLAAFDFISCIKIRSLPVQGNLHRMLFIIQYKEIAHPIFAADCEYPLDLHLLSIHLPHMIPCSYRTLACLAVLPHVYLLCDDTRVKRSCVSCLHEKA